MTPLAERVAGEPASHNRVLGLICAAHFVSHFYIVTLAPLFSLIRADFAVTYTQLGLALFVFNLTSALFQTWAGFLVDRTGARNVLIGGLLIGSAALAGAALLPTYWGFVAMFALLGLGNTVYHPADYALLSRRIAPTRLSQSYALHTFAGMVGSAAAPACLPALAVGLGWRGAYLATAVLGFVVAAVLIVFARDLAEPEAGAASKAEAAVAPLDNKKLLLSMPILLNLVIFTLLAMVSSGFQNFSVVALDALRATPITVTNVGLSIFLVTSAIGVLAGGYIAMRTSRHDLATGAGLAACAGGALLLAFFDLHTVALMLLFGIVGLCNGGIMPSRDMLVRAVTPPGAFGKVFGFVTNGFNIGGIITPLVFGWLLDHGNPQGVFIATAVFCLITIPLIMLSGAQRERA